MKKSLIALAVASAVSAPAFAATANVDMYGQILMSVDLMNRDQAATRNEFMLTSHNSRFGFKGSEDLGGGLSAIWQIETRLDADAGAFNAGARNTFLGIKSESLGTVKVGYYDTAYKRATAEFDVFSENWGDYNTIMGSMTGLGGAAGNRELFNVRETNSIHYTSPSFSGITVDASYGQRNEAGATATNPQLWSVAVSYDNGPLFLTGAYEMHKDEGMVVTAAPAINSDNDSWKLGVGYKFGDTKVAAMYERTTMDFIPAATADRDRDAWYVSADHKMGAISLKAAYANASETLSGANDGASIWTLGADYNLSKRTKFYAEYNALNQDTNARYIFGVSNSGSARITTAAGTDPSGFSFGIKHKF